jgi:hypothetical protein
LNGEGNQCSLYRFEPFGKGPSFVPAQVELLDTQPRQISTHQALGIPFGHAHATGRHLAAVVKKQPFKLRSCWQGGISTRSLRATNTESRMEESVLLMCNDASISAGAGSTAVQ